MGRYQSKIKKAFCKRHTLLSIYKNQKFVRGSQNLEYSWTQCTSKKNSFRKLILFKLMFAIYEMKILKTNSFKYPLSCPDYFKSRDGGGSFFFFGNTKTQTLKTFPRRLRKLCLC